MKKSKAKNLSKKQLKKLKGGLLVCWETKCVTNTCGANASENVCTNTDARTISISGGGSGSTPKIKK